MKRKRSNKAITSFNMLYPITRYTISIIKNEAIYACITIHQCSQDMPNSHAAKLPICQTTTTETSRVSNYHGAMTYHYLAPNLFAEQPSDQTTNMPSYQIMISVEFQLSWGPKLRSEVCIQAIYQTAKKLNCRAATCYRTWALERRLLAKLPCRQCAKTTISIPTI